MSKVEVYDLTGKYPEKIRLEKELQDIEDRLSTAKSLLSRSRVASSIDAGLGIPTSAQSGEQLEKLIEQLRVRQRDIKNELFRMNPSETE
jgi:hypothetical protein